MFSDAALAAFRNFAQVAGLHSRHPLGSDQAEPVRFPAERYNKQLGSTVEPRTRDQYPAAVSPASGGGGAMPQVDQSTTGAGIPASASAGPSVGDQPNRPTGFMSTRDQWRHEDDAHDQEEDLDDREMDLRKD
jgi:hypothetical protein